MTDTEQALAYLREQMGEGWTIGVREARHMLPPYWSWSAVARHRGVTVEVIKHPDPMSAARACVEAWRGATTALRENLEFRENDLAVSRAHEKAEREHADRLAEALRKCPAGYSGAAKQWYAKVVEPVLAAHDARRSGGGGPTRAWLEAHADDGNVSARNPDLFKRREGRDAD